MNQYATAVLVGVTLALIALSRSNKCLPPGPKPLPIIGNLHQFPSREMWRAFAKMGEKYGELVYFKVLGQSILVLNSREACVALLDKRSAIYSNRPYSVMLAELMGFNWNFVLLSYTDRWRQLRRLFHQSFNENVAPRHFEAQEQSVNSLLNRLVDDPENFLENIRLSFSETMLQLMYDIRIKDRNDPYVRLIERAVSVSAEAAVPGRYLVDLLPFLKYIPSWLPGATFQKDAAEGRLLSINSRELPAKHAMEKITSGGSRESIYSEMLDRAESIQDRKTQPLSAIEAAKCSSAMAYLAGADTTQSSIQAVFLQLANHPEVQKAAQLELDMTIGSERLPTFDDMNDLPFITAVVKEILRWHVVVPLGIAHCVGEDDEYEGYFIPKNTIILPNLKFILHDPQTYSNPNEFNPFRWVTKTPAGYKPNTELPDPEFAAFGYGRRICPGRHFARHSLYITVAKILTCFNIHPIDETGQRVEKLPEEFTDGLLIYPKPFKVSIIPRSPKALQLIRETNM